jgi:ADP-ribosylglycohydrolase
MLGAIAGDIIGSRFEGHAAPRHGSWGNRAPMRVSSVGWLAAVFQATDWEGAVRTAVGLGGDADTLGCIAGAVAEAVHGLPSDIARTARAYLSEDLDAVVTWFEPFLPARA